MCTLLIALNTTQELEEEVAFLHDRYGFDQMEYVPKERLSEVIDSDAYHGAVVDRASKHLHPLNFLLGMVEAATKAGVVIYENSRVTLLCRRSLCKPFCRQTAGGEN